MLDPVVPDGALARRLAWHEATVHAWGGRELLEMPDAVLLHDPKDAEPFWNRIAAPSWPEAGAAFDRRLDEAVTLFATLGRLPHIRTLPLANRPADLADRLASSGFRPLGADRCMVLHDPAPCLALARTMTGRPNLRLEHVGRGSDLQAMEVARLLVGAFGVETDRLPALTAETLAAGRRPGGAVLLLLAGDVPAAASRRVTLAGATYLSSIGTAPALQGRGFGSLITAITVAEALAERPRVVHLLVEATNWTAIRTYEHLGFTGLGGPISDLLMR